MIRGGGVSFSPQENMVRGKSVSPVPREAKVYLWKTPTFYFPSCYTQDPYGSVKLESRCASTGLKVSFWRRRERARTERLYSFLTRAMVKRAEKVRPPAGRVPNRDRNVTLEGTLRPHSYPSPKDDVSLLH